MSARFPITDASAYVSIKCPPSQPKERRKGKKEIHKDNEETLAFYLKFTIVGTVSCL